MRPFSDQTHYEILEVARDANAEQIERAYRIARATYSADSLATYSVYDDKEVSALQERIELAYSVLRDVDQRAAYDATLGGEPRVELALSFADESEDELEAAPEIRGFEESVYEGGVDGARLRRWRMARGIELERIASATKIGASYLKSLEEEDFAALPATVYVRGFVTAYVRAVGLDADRVVPIYMQRVLAARPEKPARPVVRRAR
ncbi:MAG: helix-turn-helix domain-containing protein [Deltaproteobacteria bacterium]|nr:helix-turn-helix domain-containing protein [Deltaproteobacteria bacterium]